MTKYYQCYLTENKCYKTAGKMTPCGIMVHSTGANNPKLSRYVQPSADNPQRDSLLTEIGTNTNGNDWNQSTPDGINVCVHAFIGKLSDGSVGVVQTLPWNMVGWHSGYSSKTAKTNANKMGYIGFEICEDGLSDKDYFASVYAAAVDLCARLCDQYGLDPLSDGVLICHSEGYSRGIASNHADVMHWFPRHGKTMDDFRRAVSDALNVMRLSCTAEAKTHHCDCGYKVYSYLVDVPDWYAPVITSLLDIGALSGVADAGTGDPRDNRLDVSDDFCRLATVLHNLRLF